jgi:nickel/cobalt transporter (NicO) family protein
MTQELTILTITAASLGFIHTVLGPDHYIPFIAMAKAGNWSTVKTTWITIMCGIGHVLSSVLIGVIGIALGVAVGNLKFIESVRGEIAGWLLMSFGLIYLMWGIRKAYLNKPHTHYHAHSDGNVHVHKHLHHDEHVHVHEKENGKRLTPWILFTIFVFGPCEVLIPILMYPAVTESTLGLVVVTSVFAITTIATMLTIVLVSLYGIKFISMGKIEKYTHAIAGATILLCGVAIKFLGL